MPSNHQLLSPGIGLTRDEQALATAAAQAVGPDLQHWMRELPQSALGRTPAGPHGMAVVIVGALRASEGFGRFLDWLEKKAPRRSADWAMYRAALVPEHTGRDVFVSYRRSDCPWFVGVLQHHLPELRWFVDADIPPTHDFEVAIRRELGSCRTLVLVIGRNWTRRRTTFRRPLRAKDDWVRIELLAAIERKMRILPVLVDGAKMPPKSWWPSDLETVSTRVAVEARWPHLDRVVQELTKSGR